jgi:predicted amidohydrolase YtcJ
MRVTRPVKVLLLLVALSALALGLAAVASAAPKPADTVFMHGFVYTVNNAHPTAHAVAVRGGKIAYIGSNQGVRAFVGAKTKVIDLKGKMLMPSFSDAHAHVQSTVTFLYAANLYGLTSLPEYLTAVQQFAADNPTMASIQGNGWSEALFPGIGPLKTDLDSVVSDRPVALWSDGHHSIWANSKALEMANITGNTPNPVGGVIERVPGTVGQPGSPYGVPSGTVREESATNMVLAAIPDFTVQQYVDGLRFYEQTIGGPLGITLVNDPVLYPGSNAIAAYAELARTGGLTMRVRGSIELVPWAKLGPQIAAAKAERAKHHGDLFQTNTVKFFADGVIEGHTGYLLKDYADRPGYRGNPIWKPAAFTAAMTAADKARFQIHVHAIGDAAVREALNSIAAMEKANGQRDRRPMITHMQLAAKSDIKRFATLGVTALPQPYWFLKDDYYHNVQVPFLGQARADREYPMKSFFDAGVNVASSSDFPVTPQPDALQGMQIGVMRWYPISQMGGSIAAGNVLWPAERVTVRQMIRSYTINGAKANFLQKETGSLEVGKSADMVVLAHNILKVPANQIGDGNKVLLTMFRGAQVYRDPGF